MMKRKIILSVVLLACGFSIWIVMGLVFGYFLNSNENCDYIGLTKQEVLKFSFENDRRVFGNKIEISIIHSNGSIASQYYQEMIVAQSDEKLMDSDSWCVNYRFRGLQAIPLFAYVAGRTYYYKLVFRNNKVVAQKYSFYSD